MVGIGNSPELDFFNTVKFQLSDSVRKEGEARLLAVTDLKLFVDPVLRPFKVTSLIPPGFVSISSLEKRVGLEKMKRG